MNKSRRNFLQKAGQLSGLKAMSLVLPPALAKSLKSTLEKYASLTPEELAQDETFWRQIRQAYSVSSTLINLNNGGVSPQPRVVQEAIEFYNRLSNETPTYYMWRVLGRESQGVKNKLAGIAGCSPAEIAINRNATESLATVIFGLRLNRGDEVVVCKQDYPSMINAWNQRAHRDGIVLKWVDLQLPSDDKDYLVKQYTKLFSGATKVVHITHMINWNGQILPVKEIAQIAHQKSIEVLVDGAHSFAQLNFKIPDLECDYFGTSLHKWLCAPFGSGMLYVKKEKIKNLYPLFATKDPESEEIKKFEAIGTRSLAIETAIGHAIDFHHLIGIKRKFQRLQYLKNYWINKVKHLKNVQLHTSQNPDFGGVITLFSIEALGTTELVDSLRKSGIHCVAIDFGGLKGIRITPNVYTLVRELDILVESITNIAHN